MRFRKCDIWRSLTLMEPGRVCLCWAVSTYWGSAPRESVMQANERDPIQKPGTSPEHQTKQLKAGRIGISLIAGVAILAFMLYAGIAIWAAVSSP